MDAKIINVSGLDFLNCMQIISRVSIKYVFWDGEGGSKVDEEAKAPEPGLGQVVVT